MSDGQIDVSLIFSAYNNGQEVVRALATLETRSNKNFEVIVVDCGSTDNTRDLLSRYQALMPNLELTVIHAGKISNEEAESVGSKEARGDRYVFIKRGEELDQSVLLESNGQRSGKRRLFAKPRLGVWNDHINQLGGGTVHGFKFIEYLRPYFDIDMYAPDEVKNENWMKKFLNLDSDGINIYQNSSAGHDYHKVDYDAFLNISHWRIVESTASKKWALIFFPQFEPEGQTTLNMVGYRFLANSEYTAENIVDKWGVSDDRVDVVYPPIMTDEFYVGDKENIIMNVARFARPNKAADKGHKPMIDTFKRLVNKGIKDWEFHLVGQVQDHDYYVELLELAQGYPIFFHKGPPFSELKKMYSKAKIYWHMTGIDFPDEPGAQEHFGMTIVEAMASGCVPISLNTGGPNETIEHKKTGYLVGNAQWLGRRTETLIDDPDKLMKMSVRCVQQAEDFSEDRVKRDLYSSVFNTDKVSIVILCHNNLEYTKQCIESLFDHTPLGFELILVDNASTDETPRYLEKVAGRYDRTKIITNDKNLSFARANNRALKQAEGEYICYLNNDTELKPGWLTRMVDVLDNYSVVGIVGPRMYFPNDNSETNEWIVQHAGVAYDQNGSSYHIGHHKPDSQVEGSGVQEVMSVTGACLLARKELAEFDEKYKRGYYEDNDLCLQAIEDGWRICIHHDAQIIHKEGATQDLRKAKNKDKYDETTKGNKELFLKRWAEKLEQWD